MGIYPEGDAEEWVDVTATVPIVLAVFVVVVVVVAVLVNVVVGNIIMNKKDVSWGCFEAERRVVKEPEALPQVISEGCIHVIPFACHPHEARDTSPAGPRERAFPRKHVHPPPPLSLSSLWQR